MATVFLYEGNYSNWLEQKEKRLEQEARAEEAHAKAIKHELEWVRSNAKGRQSKSKARLKAFEELQSQQTQLRNETQEIYIPPGPRLGENVIELNGVSKSYGDKQLFEDLSFRVPQGAIVGVIGGNGAGKSTLFKLINGDEQPDTGSVSVGETVKPVTSIKAVNPWTVTKLFGKKCLARDLIKVGNYEISSRAYLGRFNFKGQDQQKWVKDLSGGERNRLHLANTLKQGGNVLLLDEPTNDLDVETLRALEEAVLAFPGVVIMISHDRWFLDRISTHILAYEGESKVTFFEGNYTEYEADRKKRLGDLQPTRVKYKKLGN